MRHEFQRVGERQQAAGEVRPGVAFQFQHDRFIAPREPEFPTDNSLGAIVDFTADDAVMNPERHSRIINAPRTGGNSPISSAKPARPGRDDAAKEPCNTAAVFIAQFDAKSAASYRPYDPNQGSTDLVLNLTSQVISIKITTVKRI